MEPALDLLYSDPRTYRAAITRRQSPLLITAAINGERQAEEVASVPLTDAQQADEAAVLAAAGVQILHMHVRDKDDPSRPSYEESRYIETCNAIREAAPGILLDCSQMVAPLRCEGGNFVGLPSVIRFPFGAAPDIMSLNAGPMIYRGSNGSPSELLATSFDEILRAADSMRANGIKPQIFIYHPGQLDVLEYLIEHDVLEKPYFIQLVFGQESGMRLDPEGIILTVRNLPMPCVFQACALGHAELYANVFAVLLGGHVRVGLEDSALYRPDELALSNIQLVDRVTRIASDLGRAPASPAEARAILGIPER